MLARLGVAAEAAPAAVKAAQLRMRRTVARSLLGVSTLSLSTALRAYLRTSV
jgi:hypothetical protein